MLNKISKMITATFQTPNVKLNKTLLSFFTYLYFMSLYYNHGDSSSIYATTPCKLRGLYVHSHRPNNFQINTLCEYASLSTLK